MGLYKFIYELWFVKRMWGALFEKSAPHTPCKNLQKGGYMEVFCGFLRGFFSKKPLKWGLGQRPNQPRIPKCSSKIFVPIKIRIIPPASSALDL